MTHEQAVLWELYVFTDPSFSVCCKFIPVKGEITIDSPIKIEKGYLRCWKRARFVFENAGATEIELRAGSMREFHDRYVRTARLTLLQVIVEDA